MSGEPPGRPVVGPGVAVHLTAGVGSAADYMVRELLRVVPAGWVSEAAGALWRAWPPDDSAAGISVSAPSARCPFVVAGYSPARSAPTGITIRLSVSQHGFGVDEGERIIDALRAVGALPGPTPCHWIYRRNPL